MTSDAAAPTLARRYIGETLQRLRLDSALKRGQVATELGKTDEAIRRWETGQAPAAVSFIRDMGRPYEPPSDLIGRLCSLALEAKKHGIFEGRNVPSEARVLWESEMTAQVIRSVELENIPGLLQTPEYQIGLQSALLPVSAETAATNRDLRAQRQQHMFGRANPPSLDFVIGRAAINYMSDHPDIRGNQLERLRQAASLAFVDIRVPTGFHAGMMGAFTLITPRKGALGVRPICIHRSGRRSAV